MLRGDARPAEDMEAGMQDEGGMDGDSRARMELDHHRRTLWVPALVMLAGVWLASSPVTFGYGQDPRARALEVTAERSLPDIADRAAWMAASDVISGLVLVLLGLAWVLRPHRPVIPWAACIVGVWVAFAPLVLWAPDPAAYATGTVVGALVIALTILIPGMPGMIRIMEMGPSVPPGWSYNPSSWQQRVPLITLAWVGFFASRYLAAYQLGYLDQAWDPFFGGDTVTVLESDISRAWPISDAGLGAFAYSLEALMGYMGSTQRWRTMPWMVTFFGILVIPLGLMHVFLVIMQPVGVGAWCTLCLVAAGAMLMMIPLAVDEVVAMGQFVLRAHRNGTPLWRAFVYGGTVEGDDDTRSPSFGAPVRRQAAAGIWGVSFPWSLLGTTALGIWLLAAPAVVGSEGTASSSSRLTGALVITIAVTALAEPVRFLRLANLPAGAWLAVSPLLLSGGTAAGTVATVATGLAIMLLALPRGPVVESYGPAQRFIR